MPCALRRVDVLSTLPVDDEEVLPLLPEVLPELAIGLDTPPVGVDTVPLVRVAAFVCEALADPDADPDADADVAADADEDGDAAAATNGFELLPPVPCVKSMVKDVSELCWEIFSSTSSEFKALPDLEA